MMLCDAVVEEETEYDTKLLTACVLESEQSSDASRGDLRCNVSFRFLVTG